jgi:hypothetical protein
MEKTCTQCKQTKSIDSFTKKKSKIGKYYSWCKVCLSIYNRKKFKNRKQEILDILKIKECVRCGYKKYLGALEFHHEKGDKKFNLSKNQSIERSIEEAKKCIVLCSNCHKEEHYFLHNKKRPPFYEN